MYAAKFNRLLNKLNTDKKALGQIYCEYYPKIVLHIRRCFGNHITAEDTAQDLFIKLMTLEHNQYIEHPTAWLFKLAENMVIDEIRKSHEEIPLNEMMTASFDVNLLVKDESLRTYFLSLDPITQKALYMHYWEGYSFREIADELKISYGNLRVKVCRAYSKLKTILQHS